MFPRLISCSSRLTCWYVLVAIIGRITGAAGTCMASTVGTAGTAVGIPVTGAPRTSCSNLREREDTIGQIFSPRLGRWAHRDSASIPAKASRARLHAPSFSGPTAPYGAASQALEDLETPGLSGFAWKPLLFLLLRALQGHFRLHFFQAFLAALAREADTRPRDHGPSRDRESRSGPRPCHR